MYPAILNIFSFDVIWEPYCIYVNTLNWGYSVNRETLVSLFTWKPFTMTMWLDSSHLLQVCQPKPVLIWLSPTSGFSQSDIHHWNMVDKIKENAMKRILQVEESLG